MSTLPLNSAIVFSDISTHSSDMSESMYELFFGMHSDGVIICDESGIVKYTNHAALQLLGLSPGGANGKHITVTFVALYEAGRMVCENPFFKVVNSHKAFSNKRLLVCMGLGGREHLVLETAVPLLEKDNHLTGVVIYLKDFTDMADEIRIPHKMASFKTLAGGIANDFNNILTVVSNSLFMAKLTQKPGTELYNILTNAEKSAFQAAMLTNQLLSIAGEGRPVVSEIDVLQLLNNIAGFVISDAGIEYSIECEDDLPLISVDQGMLDQAIGHLLKNAVQAVANNGRISICANLIEVDASLPLPLDDGKYVCISISDTGQGIPSENITRVFDPYFTTRPGNHGLGLTLAYAAVRQHSGHITLESHGAGTLVKIFLPAVPKQSSEKPARSSGKGSVLFMDDNDLLRHSATRILEFLGFTAQTASNGEEAVAMYRDSRDRGMLFDVVILDLKVNHGLGGKEVVQDILSLNGDARVVISTGLINDPVVLDFKKYGFSGVITKPYHIEEMNVTLMELVKT